MDKLIKEILHELIKKEAKNKLFFNKLSLEKIASGKAKDIDGSLSKWDTFQAYKVKYNSVPIGIAISLIKKNKLGKNLAYVEISRVFKNKGVDEYVRSRWFKGAIDGNGNAREKLKILANNLKAISEYKWDV